MLNDAGTTIEIRPAIELHATRLHCRLPDPLRVGVCGTDQRYLAYSSRTVDGRGCAITYHCLSQGRGHIAQMISVAVEEGDLGSISVQETGSVRRSGGRLSLGVR